MGFLFGSSKQKIGETPKLPDAPAVPDPKVLEAEQRAKMRDKQRAGSSGSTMLTGMTGLSNNANTQSKGLLGS